MARLYCSVAYTARIEKTKEIMIVSTAVIDGDKSIKLIKCKRLKDIKNNIWFKNVYEVFSLQFFFCLRPFDICRQTPDIIFIINNYILRICLDHD